MKLTQQEDKLLNAVSDIYSTPPSGEDMAFTHAVLCQVGLPRSKVEGVSLCVNLGLLGLISKQAI